MPNKNNDNNINQTTSDTPLSVRVCNITGSGYIDVLQKASDFRDALMDMVADVSVIQKDAAVQGDVEKCAECADITGIVCAMAGFINDNFTSLPFTDGDTPQAGTTACNAAVPPKEPTVVRTAPAVPSVDAPLTTVAPVATLDKKPDVNRYLLPGENIDVVNEERELYLPETQPLEVDSVPPREEKRISVPPAIDVAAFGGDSLSVTADAAPAVGGNADGDAPAAPVGESVTAETKQPAAVTGTVQDDGMVSLESLMSEFGINI